MPKVSVNILTKNRKNQLAKAIESVLKQSFTNWQIVIVNDGSTDSTAQYLDILFSNIEIRNKIKIINHEASLGITQSRQEALLASTGEYVVILDDDDEWIDLEKLAKQIKYLDNNPEVVLVGGGVQISNSEFLISKQISNPKSQTTKFRPKSDAQIRSWMLIKNPFFTSTVMFKREAALRAGGFKKDETDLAEDYDLWLRMGKLGKMFNFKEPFTLYAKTQYNKAKFKLFLSKQIKLVSKYKKDYSNYWLAYLFLKLRLFL